MQQYHELCRRVLTDGVRKQDRTGTGTLSVFGAQMRFDLSEGFPIVTTKRVHLKSIVHELLWFLKGSTNIQYLTDNGVRIWDEWADEDGELGPVYGKQWRSWDSFSYHESEASAAGDVALAGDGWRRDAIDQIADVIEGIKKNPNSRRHIVSAWNVADLPKMKLPPCHLLFQFYVADGKLSCMMTQRSVDTFLGLPFNIASYALLTMMIAKVTGLEPGELIMSFGDTHIYLNHIKQVELMLQREPLSLPKMIFKHRDSIDDFVYEDFTLLDYRHHPAIKGEVSV